LTSTIATFSSGNVTYYQLALVNGELTFTISDAANPSKQINISSGKVDKNSSMNIQIKKNRVWVFNNRVLAKFKPNLNGIKPFSSSSQPGNMTVTASSSVSVSRFIIFNQLWPDDEMTMLYSADAISHPIDPASSLTDTLNGPLSNYILELDQVTQSVKSNTDYSSYCNYVRFANNANVKFFNMAAGNPYPNSPWNVSDDGSDLTVGCLQWVLSACHEDQPTCIQAFNSLTSRNLNCRIQDVLNFYYNELIDFMKMSSSEMISAWNKISNNQNMLSFNSSSTCISTGLKRAVFPVGPDSIQVSVDCSSDTSVKGFYKSNNFYGGSCLIKDTDIPVNIPLSCAYEVYAIEQGCKSYESSKSLIQYSIAARNMFENTASYSSGSALFKYGSVSQQQANGQKVTIGRLGDVFTRMGLPLPA